MPYSLKIWSHLILVRGGQKLKGSNNTAYHFGWTKIKGSDFFENPSEKFSSQKKNTKRFFSEGWTKIKGGNEFFLPVLVRLLVFIYLRKIWNSHDHRCPTSENRGVWTCQVSSFPGFLTISYKNKISHIFTLDYAIDSKTSQLPDIDDRSLEVNLTSWRHMTVLDVIWAPVTLPPVKSGAP